MKVLPQRPNLGHLKKQAKDLLEAYRRADPLAYERLRAALPVASGCDDAKLAQMNLRLHDAQSCLAREYGFDSWSLLRDYVDTPSNPSEEIDGFRRRWSRWVFGAGYQFAQPTLAVRLLQEHPQLLHGDPVLACAVGDVSLVRKQIQEHPQWARGAGNARLALGELSPLISACFSSLIGLPDYASGIRECVRLLLAAGADPNETVIDPEMPHDTLSALYAAAGRNHDAALTRILLEAGANPNDGESLYHATDAKDIDCLRLLLEAGARVKGSHALLRALDGERPDFLAMLLAHDADLEEEAALGTPLIHAIRRRRSPEIIQMLLDAGARPSSQDLNGISALRLARRMGLVQVAKVLEATGALDEDDDVERFLAACARADAATAGVMLKRNPALLSELDASQLRLLPDLAAAGCADAVRLMVKLGWPIAVRGGDIDGSALNQAVFRGDAQLARFLLAHGAHYDERHGYNDNVYGTLSFASLNRAAQDGDWLACAEALIESGAPIPEARYGFSDDVEEYFAGLRSKLSHSE